MRVSSLIVSMAAPTLIAMSPSCDSGTGGGLEDTPGDQLSPDLSEDAGPDTADTPDTSAMPDTMGDADAVGDDTATPDTAPDTQSGGPDAAPDTAPDTLPPGPDTAACPPDGPMGTALGDILADTTLTTCEGVPVSLYSFCGRPLYINTFAGWCPPCRTDASNAAATAMTFPDGAQWLFVITENNNGTAPTTAYCEAIREAYGLTMPVLIDTAGTFPAHIGVSSPNSWHLVLDAGLGIVHRVKYDQRGALEALENLSP